MQPTRECPFCGEPQEPGARACSRCGNQYPFENEDETVVEPVAAPAPRVRARRSPWTRTLPILAAVLLGAVALGYGLFRFAMGYLETGRPDPASAPPPVIASSPSPAAAPPVALGSPSPVVIGPAAAPSPTAPALGRVRVVNTEGQGANMRQRPSTTTPVVRSIPDGTSLEVIGADQQGEGRTWRNVREPTDGASGWIVAEFLEAE